MRLFIFMFIVIMMACSNSKTETESDTLSDSEVTETEAPVKETPAEETDMSGPTIASVDMGDYIVRVHEIIQYNPGDMQSKLMKMDDATKDYYVVDASVQNKSGNVLDTGRDMLAVYFKLSDGSVFKNPLKGASHLASYSVENKSKYPQSDYDMIWGNKFEGNKTARALLFGVEVPEGVKITGIGFYEKNADKNKFVDISS